jgi:hypothetical protein
MLACRIKPDVGEKYSLKWVKHYDGCKISITLFKEQVSESASYAWWPGAWVNQHSYMTHGKYPG